MHNLLFSLLLTLLLTAGCEAEPIETPVPSRTASLEAPVPEPDSTTARIFDEVMDYARAADLHERPVGEIVQAVGERFKGAPYRAGLLDEPAEEMLVCTLNGFDCVTFVETALAMARGIAEEDYSYATFARHLRDQRYRGGTMDGYCSRIHYFSEWIADNEARGNVENITDDLGGEPLEKAINFMSTHRDLYPRFATNDSLYRCIQEMEARLAGTDLYFIPQDEIRPVYDRLQAGDILGFVSNVRGLDIAHTGVVYDDGSGRKGVLHASTSGGVKVSPDLQTYVQNVDGQVGIVVARPLMP